MKYVIVVVICLCFILTGCSKHPEKSYIAHPDFSEQNFSQIQAGMSLPEVLNILGPPLSVFGPIESSREYRLEFTCPTLAALSQKTTAKDNYINYHSYSVRFSKDNLVIKKHSGQAGCPRYEGIDKTIYANQNYRRRIGNLTLKQSNGIATVLDSNDPNLYIILLGTDRCNGKCPASSATSSFQDRVDNGTVKKVFHLYTGNNPESFSNYILSLNKSQRDDCFLQMNSDIKLTVRDKDSGMLLYKAGTLHSVLAVYATLDENGQVAPYKVGIEIQNWLIEKLRK